jgi:hypothetical protein
MIVENKRSYGIEPDSGILNFFLFLFLLFTSNLSLAQDTEEIDVSKPTNLYTQFQSTLEWQDQKNANLYGYRGIFSLASPDQNHLGVLEIPLLYHDQTKKFGLGDIRMRYFGILYKDYSKLFGVFAPSVDVFIPAGKFENGLGSSSWTISPGLAAGLIFSPSFQTFPIVSYLLTTKPGTEMIPEDQKKTRNGLTFQSITVFKFTSWSLWVTPIYILPDLGDSSLKNQFVMEIRPSTQAINGKFQLAVFYRRNFETKASTLRAALVLFL